MNLTSILAVDDSPDESAVQCVIGGRDLTYTQLATVANLLAEDSMQTRCGGAKALEWWRARRDGGPPHSDTHRAVLDCFVRPGFGLPGAPASADHLQGHVAELLWNRLIGERVVCADGRRLYYKPPLKADPLEHGGDGLVVYQVDDGTLVFRLWEVKKHDSGTNKVSATVSRASNQLSTSGGEYLAKLTATETIGDDVVLADLFADMVELWLDSSDKAGAGVSIGTSTRHAPAGVGHFDSLPKALPQFPQPGQLESILVAVPDFAALAERVREVVWNGL